MPVLYRQLQRQLTAHLSQEVTSWQDIARVYDMFGEHLNPGIVCWCLTALQRVYRRGLVPAGQHKAAARRLLQQLLRLVWQWQQHLTPRECAAVAWALVNLRVKAPALRDPMRNALARQYQAALGAAAAAAAPQQQQLQQQGEVLPWAEHASLLLGLARLELPAHTHFAQGTCAAVCKLMLGLMQLQCRPGPGFMAAHMARCEAAHAGFSGSMYQELRRAYQGLGFTPSQSLMVMMYSKMGSQQQ
ncbi:hypothetical protein OEZ86_002114 [Tetradesmus obliquus]|nr:hypothetical protein OEZ86_002114 [Tetradesmus obliquus]